MEKCEQIKGNVVATGGEVTTPYLSNDSSGLLGEVLPKWASSTEWTLMVKLIVFNYLVCKCKDCLLQISQVN